MTVKKHFLSIKFLITLFFIVFFVFVIAYADRFSDTKQELNINHAFVWLNDNDSPEINIDDVTSVQLDDNERWLIKYVVQAGDTLAQIAGTFGTTVSHIKKVNHIDGPIKPKDTLVITDEEVWFLYTIPEKTNIVVFANKYNLNLEDLMTLNYIQDETEIWFSWDEIFINITEEQAIAKGLMEAPKPVIVEKPKNRPVITKPQATKPKPNAIIGNNVNITPTKRGNIISQWTYTKKISNKFYPGYCTWYAAIITPEIFKYSDDNTQNRPFGGDARQRCANAKAAGFSVGHKPVVGSLIVYKSWRVSSAGHVGKVVNYYPSEGKMIVRDMNYVAKFVVTERYEYTDNNSISCYIYP